MATDERMNDEIKKWESNRKMIINEVALMFFEVYFNAMYNIMIYIIWFFIIKLDKINYINKS